MAYSGYFSERARYQEQVAHYDKYLSSFPSWKTIEANTWDARELADLRLEAERTWHRVSTFGVPWSWLFKRDSAWSLIKPHPAEPDQDSLARMVRDWKVRCLGRSLLRTLDEEAAGDDDVATEGIKLFVDWASSRQRVRSAVVTTPPSQ